MDLSRLEGLVKEKIEVIKNSNILIIGLGGVGGYCVESLVRCGVSNITLVDNDIIELSNINRQLIALSNNIGKYKTEMWKERILLINKDANVKLITERIDESNIYKLFEEKYDYIIDACDTSKVKEELIKICYKNKIKIVSSMGMARKMDASKIIITKLNKTTNDPLAKKIRKNLTLEEMKYTTVITSLENSIKSDKLYSNSFVPAVAGLLITSYIINDIVNK